MVRKLIQWSLNNALLVLLLAVGLVIVGIYAYLHINVEAYPDPAPPTVEVVRIVSGCFRRGGGAPGHDPLGSGLGRDARLTRHE